MMLTPKMNIILFINGLSLGHSLNITKSAN
jgi:hypothetical protein